MVKVNASFRIEEPVLKEIKKIAQWRNNTDSYYKWFFKRRIKS